MKSLLQVTLSLFVIFQLANDAVAEDFLLKHPTCDAKYIENPSHTKKFKQTINSQVKDKNYKLKIFNKHAKMDEGDLYFMIDLIRAKSGLYKKCDVEVSLRVAKSRHMSSGDKVLATKKITRQFPRLTRAGNERCIRALKDAFVHIPPCKSGF